MSNATEKAVLKDGRTVDFLPDMIGDGAMKEVYFTADKRSVVCFYKDPKEASSPNRVQRLERLLTKWNVTVPQGQGGAAHSDLDAGYYLKLFCWPTGIIERPRFGIVTPVYPPNFFFKQGPFSGKEKNGSFFTLRKPRMVLSQQAPDEVGTWLNYLRFCVQMARAVARLHQAGLAHSDLSPNNILVDPAGGHSVVIDIDSLVVPGVFPPDVLGTKGYIAPEVLSTINLAFNDPNRKHPCARTDEHALAVLIYQYLLRRHPLDGKRIPTGQSAEEQEFQSYGPQALFCEDPSDAANRPEEQSYIPYSVVGQELQKLFEQAFVTGLHAATKRPMASEWVRGLMKTWDLVVPCPSPSCPHKWFVADPNLKGPLRCPICGARPKTNIPLLKLRRQVKAGQWATDGVVAVYDDGAALKKQIFRWHVLDNVLPGPGADTTPQAYGAFYQGQWFLINQNLSSLTSPSGNRVLPGQAVALAEGAQIRLSQDEHGRIAEVAMLKV